MKKSVERMEDEMKKCVGQMEDEMEKSLLRLEKVKDEITSITGLVDRVSLLWKE